MNTEIFRCVAGSNLFGTATPSSDTDYKAVHIADAKSILMGTADAVIDQSTGSNNSSNTAEDVDMLSLPIPKFLKGLAKMDANAVEMFFAPNIHDDWLWTQLTDARFKLLSRNKGAFLGYANNQAMRYAVRGDRIDCLEKLVTTLECFNPNKPMTADPQASDILSVIPHVSVENKPNPGGGVTPYLTAFGRSCPLTCLPRDAIKIYKKPLAEAGKRTMEAANGGGPDWKGLYHAQRIVDEGIELFSTGELIFPCEGADYYLDIRSGDVHIDKVLDHFEWSLAELEAIEPISDFPEKADQEWIDEFIYSVHEQKVVDAYEIWRSGE